MAILKEVASIIKNDITAGLKGVGNFSFSLEQLEKEIVIRKNALIKKYSSSGMLPHEDLVQNIDVPILSCKDMSDNCEIKSGVKALHFEVPRFASVFDKKYTTYVGSIDKMRPFKVFYDQSFLRQRFSPVAKNKPYVWFDIGTLNEDDTINGYVFNVPRLKYISVKGIFEDPYQVLSCNCKDEEDLRFPAPEFIVDEIIATLVSKYINIYKSQPVLPNTQPANNQA